MIILNCEQGTPEWIEARLGIPTASCFSKIITPTGRASSSQADYKRKLIAEWVCGEPFDEFMGNEWTDRGTELEPQARKQYEFDTDMEVKQIGFAYANEQKMWGASPDGLVGDDGLLELKVPSPQWHLYYLSEPELPTKYRIQVQGQMWVCQREFCDFMSFHPDYPTMRVRVEKDESLHAAFEEHIGKFVEELQAARTKLLELGVTVFSNDK